MLGAVVLSESGHEVSSGDDGDKKVEAHVHDARSDGVAFVQELSSHNRDGTDADLCRENDLNECIEPRRALMESVKLKGPQFWKWSNLEDARHLPGSLEQQKSQSYDAEHQQWPAIDSTTMCAANKTKLESIAQLKNL